LFTYYGSNSSFVDYVFTAAGPAALTSPPPNSVLAGPKVTFTWSTAGGATGYSFRLGTTVGGNDVSASGIITATSTTPTNLPTNGETLYGRLFTYYGSNSSFVDYVFTAAGPAALTSPPPNSVLAGPKVTFTWSTAGGATGYSFRLGTTVGGNDVSASGIITATSTTPTNLPTNGETLYGRLFTYYGSNSSFVDYVFTAAGPAALTSPAPNSVLAGPTVTFTWSTAGGAIGYSFRLGTTLRGNDVSSSGFITATSTTPTNLPTNGETLYGRLFTYYGSNSSFVDYVFTVATTP